MNARTLDCTAETSDAQIEQFAFECFATAHPHEAYEAYPERFWDWFHKEHPNIERTELEALLAAGE